MKQNMCCCFGQSEIVETDELKITLRVLIENLIADERVDGFFFEEDSQFSKVCYDIVASMRQRYPLVDLIRCTVTHRDMIQSSRFCLVYYDEDASAIDEKDVRMALEYADEHKKSILQVPWPRKTNVL